MAWYFNDNYPWLGHAVLRADHRAVVLVHRPVHRAAGAGRAERDRGPARDASSPRFLKLLPVFIFIIPGMICFALAKPGKVPGARA